MRFRIAVALIAALSLSCSVGAQFPATPTGIPPEVLTALPAVELTMNPVLQVTLTPASTATSEPFIPFSVTTWADNVLLRSNPGHLFDKLAILPKGTSLRVTGRAMGGEWLMVQTGDNRSGWVSTRYVEAGAHDPERAPEVRPADALLVRGRVSDANGLPVSGIQYAIVQGSGSNAPRTDAMTDASGVFYAFMPASTKGTWWVSYTAISCESNIMSPDCSTWNGTSNPKGVYIDLPQADGSILEFAWK